MQVKTDLEKELDEEILNRAKIRTNIDQAHIELNQMLKQEADSTYKISKIRFHLNPREEDK